MLRKIAATIGAVVKAPVRQCKQQYQAVRAFGDLVDSSQQPRVAALMDYFLRCLAQWIDYRKQGRSADDMLQHFKVGR